MGVGAVGWDGGRRLIGVASRSVGVLSLCVVAWVVVFVFFMLFIVVVRVEGG